MAIIQGEIKCEKLEKYQGLNKEYREVVESQCFSAHRFGTTKQEKWLKQNPGTTSEITVQKSAVLGTTELLSIFITF